MVRASCRRASLSGAKRKVEELTEEAKPVEVVRTPALEEEPPASRVRLHAQAVARAEEEKSAVELAPLHDAGTGSSVPAQEVAGRATVEPSRLRAINPTPAQMLLAQRIGTRRPTRERSSRCPGSLGRT
jgi:hypothetical protein